MTTEVKERTSSYFFEFAVQRAFTSRVCFELPQRTGRPNIGHATGRGVLPDGRINFRAMLVEEEALPYAREPRRLRFSYGIIIL
ncbi:hypothetical protein [Evansella tamaricis]|uniref:Uncharacterized protein n=1 Tax=Evansella tamaricis TaxID=2069301 RepID=A0ABS6JHS6_9BACI|nr:hypothetical protein [Evansella tamaricis]MBU9712779.1 hypothetical protein [Evansella tamaricis]